MDTFIQIFFKIMKRNNFRGDRTGTGGRTDCTYRWLRHTKLCSTHFILAAPGCCVCCAFIAFALRLFVVLYLLLLAILCWVCCGVSWFPDGMSNAWAMSEQWMSSDWEMNEREDCLEKAACFAGTQIWCRLKDCIQDCYVVVGVVTSGFVLLCQIVIKYFQDALILWISNSIVIINDFRGDLTDVFAITKILVVTVAALYTPSSGAIPAPLFRMKRSKPI